MKTGYSILGLADVFKKVADAILENDEITTVEFSAEEFEDFDEVGEFVYNTLKGMKCDVRSKRLDEKYVLQIFA